ncbi:MAG: rhombosortase [Psychromonas sp.]|nr:rhombosortase [Psychromonas sp.]
MFYSNNKRLILELITLIALTFIVYLFEPKSSLYLAYYHSSIARLEVWRFFTASFCHTNFNHFLMNVIGLTITPFLFLETYQKFPLWPLILFNSLFIGLAIFFIDPTILSYVGLSGVLHGLFSYGVMNDIARKDKWGWILGFGIVTKVVYEQCFGAAQVTIEEINAPVLINAHLYGVIAGILFYLILLIKNYNFNR